MTVSTRRLRAALIAVLPHASTDKDDVFLTRVRVYAGGHQLVVCATDRFTAAMAWVDLDESTGEVGCFDLTTTDVQQLLAVHRVPKEGSFELRLGHDGKHLRATDVSGLGFGGKSLRLEALSVDKSYPDVPDLIARVARSAADRLVDPGSSLNLVWGAATARFTLAAKAFDEFLSIEAIERPRALLVSCGESFLGVLIPRGDSGSDALVRVERRLRLAAAGVAGMARLGHPLPEPVKAQQDQVEVQDLGDLIPSAQDLGGPAAGEGPEPGG